MKIAVLISKDGLGNQMFQYVYARTLQQKKKSMKLLVCTEGFRDDKNGRSFSLHHFCLNDKVCILSGFWNKVCYKIYREYKKKLMANKKYQSMDVNEKINYLQRRGVYLCDWGNPYMDLPVNYSKMPVVFIWGDFQNPHLWNDVSFINEELTIKEKVADKNKKMLQMIKDTESVCMHVRRGDYVDPKSKWFKLLNICNEDYYLSAMDNIAKKIENPVFFLFSNSHEDIEWIMHNYSFGYQVVPVDLNNQDYEDLQLMTECKHFILSNSTYSYWAQYLSENKGKVVVAPEKWNNKVNAKNLYSEKWEII